MSYQTELAKQRENINAQNRAVESQRFSNAETFLQGLASVTTKIVDDDTTMKANQKQQACDEYFKQGLAEGRYLRGKDGNLLTDPQAIRDAIDSDLKQWGADYDTQHKPSSITNNKYNRVMDSAKGGYITSVLSENIKHQTQANQTDYNQYIDTVNAIKFDDVNTASQFFEESVAKYGLNKEDGYMMDLYEFLNNAKNTYSSEYAVKAKMFAVYAHGAQYKSAFLDPKGTSEGLELQFATEIMLDSVTDLCEQAYSKFGMSEEDFNTAIEQLKGSLTEKSTSALIGYSKQIGFAQAQKMKSEIDARVSEYKEKAKKEFQENYEKLEGELINAQLRGPLTLEFVTGLASKIKDNPFATAAQKADARTLEENAKGRDEFVSYLNTAYNSDDPEASINAFLKLGQIAQQLGLSVMDDDPFDSNGWTGLDSYPELLRLVSINELGGIVSVTQSAVNDGYKKISDSYYGKELNSAIGTTITTMEQLESNQMYASLSPSKKAQFVSDKKSQLQAELTKATKDIRDKVLHGELMDDSSIDAIYKDYENNPFLSEEEKLSIQETKEMLKSASKASADAEVVLGLNTQEERTKKTNELANTKYYKENPVALEMFLSATGLKLGSTAKELFPGMIKDISGVGHTALKYARQKEEEALEQNYDIAVQNGIDGLADGTITDATSYKAIFSDVLSNPYISTQMKNNIQKEVNTVAGVFTVADNIISLYNNYPDKKERKEKIDDLIASVFKDDPELQADMMSTADLYDSSMSKGTLVKSLLPKGLGGVGNAALEMRAARQKEINLELAKERANSIKTSEELDALLDEYGLEDNASRTEIVNSAKAHFEMEWGTDYELISTALAEGTITSESLKEYSAKYDTPFISSNIKATLNSVGKNIGYIEDSYSIYQEAMKIDNPIQRAEYLNEHKPENSVMQSILYELVLGKYDSIQDAKRGIMGADGDLRKISAFDVANTYFKTTPIYEDILDDIKNGRIKTQSELEDDSRFGMLADGQKDSLLGRKSNWSSSPSKSSFGNTDLERNSVYEAYGIQLVYPTEGEDHDLMVAKNISQKGIACTMASVFERSDDPGYRIAAMEPFLDQQFSNMETVYPSSMPYPQKISDFFGIDYEDLLDRFHESLSDGNNDNLSAFDRMKGIALQMVYEKYSTQAIGVADYIKNSDDKSDKEIADAADKYAKKISLNGNFNGTSTNMSYGYSTDVNNQDIKSQNENLIALYHEAYLFGTKSMSYVAGVMQQLQSSGNMYASTEKEISRIMSGESVTKEVVEIFSALGLQDVSSRGMNSIFETAYNLKPSDKYMISLAFKQNLINGLTITGPNGKADVKVPGILQIVNAYKAGTMNLEDATNAANTLLKECVNDSLSVYGNSTKKNELFLESSDFFGVDNMANMYVNSDSHFTSDATYENYKYSGDTYKQQNGKAIMDLVNTFASLPDQTDININLWKLACEIYQTTPEQFAPNGTDKKDYFATVASRMSDNLTLTEQAIIEMYGKLCYEYLIQREQISSMPSVYGEDEKGINATDHVTYGNTYTYDPASKSFMVTTASGAVVPKSHAELLTREGLDNLQAKLRNTNQNLSDYLGTVTPKGSLHENIIGDPLHKAEYDKIIEPYRQAVEELYPDLELVVTMDYFGSYNAQLVNKDTVEYYRAEIGNQYAMAWVDDAINDLNNSVVSYNKFKNYVENVDTPQFLENEEASSQLLYGMEQPDNSVYSFNEKDIETKKKKLEARAAEIGYDVELKKTSSGTYEVSVSRHETTEDDLKQRIYDSIQPIVDKIIEKQEAINKAEENLNQSNNIGIDTTYYNYYYTHMINAKKKEIETLQDKIRKQCKSSEGYYPVFTMNREGHVTGVRLIKD